MRLPVRMGSDRYPSQTMIVRNTLIIVICWGLTFPAAAQESIPSPEAIAKTTIAAVSKHHLQKPVLDLAFCERWLTIFLNTLDPGKRYRVVT